MNLYEQQREIIQHEINRLNFTLKNEKLEPRQFSKLNRRRSQLLRKAETLKIAIRIVG